MAGEPLVNADATDKAMIVSLFIGLPPFSPLILSIHRKRRRSTAFWRRGVRCGAQLDAPLSNNRTRCPLGRTRRIGSPASPRPAGRRLDRGECTRPQVVNYFILRNSIEIIIAIQQRNPVGYTCS
ncbi:hypothetical protein, partial [Ensifer sp. 22564]|uniref:hypothetical protein n=1 Tax=Ensifer sp. 22564 TaxID=3453943 RepID=UPI003F859593